MGMSVSSYLIVGVKLSVKKITKKEVNTRYNEITGEAYQKTEKFDNWALCFNDIVLIFFKSEDSICEFLEDLEDKNKSLCVYLKYEGWGDGLSEVILGSEVCSLDKDSIQSFNQNFLGEMFIEAKDKFRNVNFMDNICFLEFFRKVTLKECEPQLHHVLSLD